MKVNSENNFGVKSQDELLRFRFILIGYLIVLLILFSFPDLLFGQDTDTDPQPVTRNNTPSVFLDCSRCDFDHIRREISFVNYVREPQQADIHLFITSQGTGDGGREYELSFIGRRHFSDMRYDFKHYVSRNATPSEIREELNRAIEMGLLPYTLQAIGSSDFTLQYDPAQAMERQARTPEEDPWRYWVFEIYAGSLSLDMQTNQTGFDSRWGFFADKVTENWKLRFRPFFNYNFDEIQRSDDEEPVVSRRHRHGIDSFVIRSISDHWSAGLFGEYLTRIDRNIKHQFEISPGIEYSLFPYDIATRRSITFVYRIGYSYVDYFDETIFNQTEEHLVNHRLSASVGIEQPWGSISGGLIGSHFFHDFEKRRAEFFGRLSVRLVEGLSLSFGTSFEMIRDQLSLRKGDASLEDVLLRQQELATDFELSGFIALSYTFGSDFANIVNTRF